jgi:hypothetical protein
MSIQKQRNEVSRLLRMSNRHRNVMRWSEHETIEHVSRKFEICFQLKKWGHEFYTEAIFEPSGLRADVIDADTGIVYEVYQTESMDSLKKKALLYPLEVRFVSANEAPFTEEMLL